jgi:GGDEF domain-containing protein
MTEYIAILLVVIGRFAANDHARIITRSKPGTPVAASYECSLRGEIRSYSREKRYVRKDGQIIWTNIPLSALRDASGRVQSAISIVEDISGRKALERQFEDTIEQAAVGIAHVDLDERTMRVNRKFCDITGYATGVLFIDLDLFENINDTLGHEAGDHVLKDVAVRLRGCRHGGAENS